jgi:LysM repeat protein
MADSLDALAAALAVAAKQPPVILNAALLSANGVTPPPGLDDSLRAAFKLGAGAPGLPLTFTSGDVGPVTNDSFSVTNAQLSFLGMPLARSNVTVQFTGTTAPVRIIVQTNLSDWTLTDTWPYMNGWPFSLLALAGIGFVYSTAPVAAYAWHGSTIALVPGQNMAAGATVPKIAQEVFALLGLTGMPSSVVVNGKIEPELVDNETIIYPNLALQGTLATQPVTVLKLSARNPSIGLTIETDSSKDENGDIQIDQTPYVYFGLLFSIDTVDGKSVELAMQASFDSAGDNVAFAVMPTGTELLTPATVAGLVGGESYFRYVPAELQQYLSVVGLKGLSIGARLGTAPAFTRVGAALGSAPGMRWVILTDPNNDSTLAIEHFVLNWMIYEPFGANQRSDVSFSAEMTMFPKVFHNPDGTPGIFSLTIDQNLSVFGGYAGSVSLDDVLREISGGAIGLPNGIEITFSDVTVAIDKPARTYAFGFTLDAAVKMVEWGGKPLIQIEDMQFSLTATVPRTGSATLYQAGITGLLGIGPFVANVEVRYDGTSTPSVWALKADLAQTVPLSEVVNQFFEAYDLPAFFPGSLEVLAFGIEARLPSKPKAQRQPPLGTRARTLALAAAGSQPSYNVYGTVRWSIELVPGKTFFTQAQLGLQFDGNLAPSSQFAGSAIGTIGIAELGPAAELMIGYQFGPGTDGKSSKTLWMQWEGLRATYDFTKQTVTFSLEGWSVGTLLQALVRMIGDPYFTLDAPWNVLDQISLDGLSVSLYLGKDPRINRVSATYTLSNPIDLGFMRIDGLTFKQVNGKVTLALSGSTSVPGLKDSALFNPASGGQDVQNMPPVPGQGNEYFELRLLALGQRVGIVGSGSFTSTQAVIKALEGVPSTTGKRNPVDPTSTTKGQPYYDQRFNWLVATDFGLLKVGEEWTLSLMIVFNDPDLYGLRLTFAGTKAKVLAGLEIDILYQKITDDIGLYRMDFSFPAVLRQLQFGVFAVTLPSIGIQIYTNGDFLIDFGFPYNMDFSRSFTVQAQIGPVPVLGSAGFYFGKLSGATATTVPKTTKGTFNPVVVFGLGVQLGIGKTIDAGILRAGFSITVFGIIEGTIAAWHPYQLGNTGNPAEVQGDYYFKLSGQFGLIGKLYGTVDFVVIKANVSLTITLSAKITYESFHAIPLSLSAAVSVSVSIEIDLGLFSFSISFSFGTTISLNLTLGQDQLADAPWYDGTQLDARASRFVLAAAPVPSLVFKTRDPQDTVPSPSLDLYVTPQFTVIGSPGGAPAAQTGAFVLLLSTDAPTTTGTANATNSSFEHLSAAMFVWLMDALLNPRGTTYLPASVEAQSVTRAQLESLMTALADTAVPPLPASAILAFLASALAVNVQPAAAGQTVLRSGATIFPPFTGFSIVVPNASGTGTTTIAFGDYVTITDAYRARLALAFEKLAARVEQENPAAPASLDAAAFATEPEQLAQFIFEDYFLLMAKQFTQAAIDALDSFAYSLAKDDQIATIRDRVVKHGNPQVTDADVVAPNLEHALTAGITLSLAGIAGTVQRGDTLTTIARRYSDSTGSPVRWTTSPAELILANASKRGWIAPNVPVTYGTGTVTRTYTTLPGDSFDAIAAAFQIDIAELAVDALLYDITGLLVPAAAFSVPPIAYTTASGDTTRSVMDAFGVPLTELLAANATVPNYFDRGAAATIHVSNLLALEVGDLWASMSRAGTVANTAGMAARYQLHGMRLPADPGLTLPPDFVYPSTPADGAYGLYQLTGQQFPTPDVLGTYGITLQKDASLDWLKFAGSTTTTSLAVDLTDAAKRLSTVLACARKNPYDPQPAIAPLPDVAVQPKAYAIRQYAPWSTSDASSLLAVTGAATNVKPQPVLWTLPLNVLRLLEQRSVALGARFGIDVALTYLPVLAPQLGSTDPATRLTSFVPLTDYTFATRVDFRIRRLAQAEGQAPQRPGATNIVPPSSGNTGSTGDGLAPHTYELLAPSPADAILLERLLTAMDTLGESVISGLFLLQATGGSGTTGLVSRGENEFLAFITQTNLSTETNPPSTLFAAVSAADETRPRGIANTPANFVKLLWELSTVRSGGYYLYYQVPGNDQPLSSDLFDADGVATMTLVITYQREPIGAGRLTGFVNALATTQAIDLDRTVLTLASQSASAVSATLDARATLSGIAALYGMSPGTVAANNATAALAEGSEIELDGLVTQMTQADLQSGDGWAAIAAYYAQGTVVTATGAALTGVDLQMYNSSVPAALLALVRIPALTYSVAGANAAGDTFASIARYFRLTTDAVAAGAKTAPGLFGTTKIAVDPQQFDVQPAVGVGNAGFTLTRANLGPPMPPPTGDFTQSGQGESYARAYLFSLYTLLAPSLVANPFFDTSSSGVPCGPTTPTTPQQAAAFRRPEARRAHLLAARDTSKLFYEQTIGFGEFSRLNAAPVGGGDLPTSAANPYVGVGSVAQIAVAWADVFGNRTVTPPSVVAVPLDYVDQLIGPSMWPNLASSYTYTGTTVEAALRIDLALRTDAYFPPPPDAAPTDTRRLVAASGLPQWQQNIENDLATYTRVYFQLEQNYDGLKVPGLSGNAVDILLTDALFGSVAAPLPASEAAKVRAYVSDCVAYLHQRKDGKTPPSTPARHLDVPVVVADAIDNDIVRLRVALTLARRPALSDPALAAQLDGLTATAEVPAQTDTTDGVALTGFAAAFEAIFTTKDWDLRVGTGNGEPSQPRSAASHTVWAVRMAKNASGKGLGFELGTEVSYYAARPVANALRSGITGILSYTSGSGLSTTATPTTFNGVDLNAWAQSVLGAIDTFLSPTFSSPAFVVDAMGSEPETSGVVAKILRHKETLANAIGSTVAPILVTSRTDVDSLAAANEKLRQELLRELSAAYTVSAIAVCDVTGATYTGTLPAGVKPPRFHGQPVRPPSTALTAGAPEPGMNYALSSTRIPLTMNADGNTRMAFAFSSKNVTDAAQVTLPLCYVGAHLEYDITSVPGIKGYEQSSWITFVTAPVVRDLAGGNDLHIPIPLRALPTPPTLTVQTAQPWEQTATSSGALRATGQSPVNLARWTYGFGYTGSRFAQDAVRATVDFNLMPSAALFATPDDLMFATLAQFVSVYPQIAVDFQTALRGIDANTDPASAQVGVARNAMDTFESLVGQFAAAYVAWAAQNSNKLFAQETGLLPAVRFVFDLRLTKYVDPNTGEETDDARIDVIQVSLEPTGTTLPSPFVQVVIPGETLVPENVDPPKDALVSYRYVRPVPTPGQSPYVTYDEALLNPTRTVNFRPLELFGFQSAQSGVQIERNEFLVPGVATTETFRFSTPLVRFTQPIVPLLRYLEYDLTQASPGPLAYALSAFFGQLLSNAGTQSVLVGLRSSFSYELVAGMPRPAVPIVLLPPTTATAANLAFVAPLVTMIERWRTATQPQEQAAGAYDFALLVFSTASGFGQLPLLQIAELSITAAAAFPPVPAS